MYEHEQNHGVEHRPCPGAPSLHLCAVEEAERHQCEDEAFEAGAEHPAEQGVEREGGGAGAGPAGGGGHRRPRQPGADAYDEEAEESDEGSLGVVPLGDRA